MTKKMEEAKNLMLQGFNCSQSVSAVFAEAYGQDKANILKIASGFGGGMRQAEVCGAVSGAIMVVGFKYGIDETNMQDKGLCYEKTLEFVNRFKEKNNSILCRKLLGYDISTDQGMQQAKEKNLFTTTCIDMVTDAVMILETLGY